MSRIAFSLTAAAALLFMFGLTGCTESSAPSSDAGNRAAEGEADHGHSHEDGHTHEDGHSHDEDGHSEQDTAAIKASLAKLSPEERASAEAQKICPVSDHALGSMDAPVKVAVDGKEVWVCCAACEDPLKADPEKYLAKLPKKD